jgi:hypothetical protein
MPSSSQADVHNDDVGLFGAIERASSAVSEMAAIWKPA